MSLQKAISWTILWVIVAIFFNIGIYHFYGAEKASQFANVYIIEKLLSFDNLFVFLLIFNYFKVPERERRRVLNYGICGAIILRAIFIGFGIVVVNQFHGLLYGMGILLLYSAWGVAFCDEEEDKVSTSRVVRFAQSLSISPFFIWCIAIELSDIVFAIDSMPASLSISQDMLIVYMANIFAILGLRSLFFVIQYLYDYIPQLKYGIAIVLAFIGIKMLMPMMDIHIESIISLIIVISILVLNVLIIIATKGLQKDLK